jgi:predicted Zn-dependent protease
MPVLIFLRQSLMRPKAAAGLLLLAIGLWGAFLFGQQRGAPVRRHIAAGMEYARRGNAEKAEREWRSAVRLDPENATAWELLGEFYFSTRSWHAAADAFRNLLRIHPDAPDGYARLAAATLCTGEEKAAYRYAQEELKRDPDDVGALTVAVALLAYMGEDERRLEYLGRLAKLRPNDLEFLTMYAEALIYKHHYREARPVIEQILRLARDNAQAFSLRGVCTFHEDLTPQGLKKAEADFLRALQIEPLAPFPRFYLGKLYKRAGQPKKAVFQLENAAHFMPNKMDIFFELAEAFERAGQPRKAALARKRFETLRDEASRLSVLEKRCAMNPDNFDYHLELGLLTLQKGDQRKSGFYLSRALGMRPGDARAKAAFRQFMEKVGVTDPRILAKVQGSAAPPDAAQ